MLTLKAQTVNDAESATVFVRECVAKIGIGYHPDTPMTEYSNAEGQTFTAEEAERLDLLNEAAADFIDPYEVALDAAHETVVA